MEEVAELLAGILKDTNWPVAEAAYESEGMDNDDKADAGIGGGGCCTIS